MSDEIQKELIERYLNKRQLNASDIKECDSYVTPRSLLGLIRFCQARVSKVLNRHGYGFLTRFREKIFSSARS